jgi:exosome complex component RRP42
MEKVVFPKLNKKKISELLKDGKRLDGRKQFDFRDISIESGISNMAEGSARVKIGKTEVIVGAKLNAVEPYADGPDEGTLMVSMEFSPISGERHESGPPKMDSIEVARVVDRGIRESGFIDWKKLCIKEGEKVWSIAIDIYCTNDDGNVFDASAIGAVVALRTAVFPVYNEKEGMVKFGEYTKDKLPLTDNVPLTMTFYKVGSKLLADPNRDEEDASESRITLAISSPKKEKMINSMQKGGIVNFSGEDIETVSKESQKIYEALFPDIDKQIKAIK